jgi:Ala-tRNA(Pro) deacylase
MKLDEFLIQRRIPFERMYHQPAFTADRVAQYLHVPGKDVAKTVLLRTPHGYVLAVLPATHHVDLDQVKRDLGEESVEMATEQEIEQLFQDCERGAMPPFGSLYQLPTIVDDALAKDEKIVFEAQNHEEAIRMTFHDFAELERPRIGHFASGN